MLDRDAFLKLLVAQLRYQDPSKPLDATEMVSQSAQLSVVDKLGEISALLTDSSAVDRVTLAGSLIGKQISFTAPDGTTQTAIATAVSVAGASTVVRAGNVDVDIDDITSITQPSAPSSNGQTP
jgi:flagellar hook assembly protein FlgD